MNAGGVFAEPLVDLGADNPTFADIKTPLSALGAAKIGVTAQFLERAHEYHRSYLDLDYWRFLIGRAVQAAGLRGAPAVVIDIWAGSRDSVVPPAARFPRAAIVAPPISPPPPAVPP